MDRRKALINLGILTGGITLLPACQFSKEKVSFALNNLEVNEYQADLVKEIISVIIPEGELPGAISLHVDDFIWIMVDDMLNKSQQKIFFQGLNSFESEVKHLSGKNFNSLDGNKRSKAIEDLINDTNNTSSEKKKAVTDFILTIKEMTIIGYMKSEFIMTEVMPYSLVPGKYGTCETIDTTKRINING